MASLGMLRLAIALPHWSRLGIGQGQGSPIPLATYGVGLVIDLLAAEASR